MKDALEYLKANQARFVDELCSYVRFPSISAQQEHRGDMAACANWLTNECRKIGLDSKVYQTDGHPIVLARTPIKCSNAKPHFVVYGHYDVQPPDPLELWHTPPFEPRIKGRSLFARGASDNKGQHLAHLKAVEAVLRTQNDLPCHITFLIEGEEEVGSSSLSKFLAAHKSELRCNAVVVSDTGMPARGMPALTYALRGVAAIEITVTGPKRDLHSGIFGGSVENPAMALCKMLASVRDKNGRVTIPGFYDDVRALTRFERNQLRRLPFNAHEYAKFLGVPALFGEKGFTPWEQRTTRPTFEINGLTSGYQGEGSKTIIPSTASAKITMRLVPDQNPARVSQLVRRYFRKVCPKTVRLKVSVGHGGQPYIFSPTSPLAKAALRALEAAFGQKPVLMREGGSIPIVTEFKRILGADTLMLGLALPDDNAHSPNEKFDLDNFAAGMRLGVHLWYMLAQAAK